MVRQSVEVVWLRKTALDSAAVLALDVREQFSAQDAMARGALIPTRTCVPSTPITKTSMSPPMRMLWPGRRLTTNISWPPDSASGRAGTRGSEAGSAHR